MARLWAHLRALWPGWALLSPLPFALWPLYCFSIGERRWEHAAFIVGPAALAYTNEKTKRLYVGLYPIGLVGLLYDSMRFVKNVGLTPERVHVCDLRAHEVAIFGVPAPGGGRETLNDFFQAHSATALDLYCAIPYGVFIFAIVGFAVYLYAVDFEAMRRFTWSFFALNLAGFVTYHIYPAAPPWYFHAHGCVVDLASHASAGPNLTRVDTLLGVDYFTGLYGRSNDVFGAVPSLHVAYPLLIVFETFRRKATLGRAVAIWFFASMCFAAVYLDHHWGIDVALGILYATTLSTVIKRALDARTSRQPAGETVPSSA